MKQKPSRSGAGPKPKPRRQPAPSGAQRGRGAQPGNLNALKHGFYAKHLQPDELAQLADASSAALNGEIGLTRIAARRVLGLLDEADTVEAKTALLSVLTCTAMRVASLLKTKKYLSGNSDDLTGALQQALSDIAAEVSIS